MDIEQISELHYICHIENLNSILKYGILSHNTIRKMEILHKDVSMEIVQDRRKIKCVYGARPLHDYVNIYFHARNPMLFKLQQKYDDLCVLRIDKNVLCLPNIVIADGNASSDYVRFYPSSEGIEKLDFNLVFAKYWKYDNDDEITQNKKKLAKCAEVLIPERVEPKCIIGAYVYSETALKKINCHNIKLNVIINKELFFELII